MFPSWILWNFSNFLRKGLCKRDHGKCVFFSDLKFSLFHKISPLWNIKPVSPHFLKSALYIFSSEHVSLHRDSPYSRWRWTSNNTIPDLSFFFLFFFFFCCSPIEPSYRQTQNRHMVDATGRSFRPMDQNRKKSYKSMGHQKILIDRISSSKRDKSGKRPGKCT